MSDRGPGMDVDLIERLADLGEQIDRELAGIAGGLADDVLARLEAEPHARPRREMRGAHVWRLAAAAVLVVAVVVALPGPRRTIARWFGIGSVRIEPIPARPDAAVPVGVDEPDLGPAVTAAAAVEATGLPLPVAGALDEPTSFHLPGGPQIVARYDVDGRIVLVASLAGAPDWAFVKQVDARETVAVGVDGADGLWIGGDDHWFGYVDRGGTARREPLRLARPTLLWERGGTTWRVEGAADLDHALEIAGSIDD